MTKYICIENDVVVSLLDYEPNVPSSVSVYPITDDEVRSIENKTHIYDVPSRRVIPIPGELRNENTRLDLNSKSEGFLARTDWMILRHLREQALRMPTTLTEDKYLELERQRQQAADSIVR